MARNLLLAANQQPYGFLKVRGREIVYEVEQLAAAGLVEAVSGYEGPDASAVIKCVTDAGYAFLRAFKDESVAKAAERIRRAYYSRSPEDYRKVTLTARRRRG